MGDFYVIWQHGSGNPEPGEGIVTIERAGGLIPRENHTTTVVGPMGEAQALDWAAAWRGERPLHRPPQEAAQ